MKKYITYMLVLGMLIMSLTGCGKNLIIQTYIIDDNTSVDITFDKNTGYAVTESLPFSINKSGKTVVSGFFVNEQIYSSYLAMIKAEDGIYLDVLDEGSFNGNEYLLYSASNETVTEYDYIVKLADSSLGVIMGGTESKEEVIKCYESLTFSVHETPVETTEDSTELHVIN